MDDKKVIANFDEELDIITAEPDAEDTLRDEEIEEISTEELSDVDVAGGKGKDGSWVTFGRYSYMVVEPTSHAKCSMFNKGPNRYPYAVVDKTCSACTHLFKNKGFWLCAKSKTEF